MSKIDIKAPRLNSNDDELLILKIHVKKGDKIKIGSKLLSVETSKTAVDIDSEFEGIVLEVKIKEGQYVNVDEDVLSLEVDGTQVQKKSIDNNNVKNNQTNKNRISLKALKLIEERKINIKDLDYIKTEIKLKDVIDHIKNSEINNDLVEQSPAIILGTGLHAMEIADTLENNKIPIHGFCTKEKNLDKNFKFGLAKIICNDSEINQINNYKSFNYFIGVGGPTSNNLRMQLYKNIDEMGLKLPFLVSKKAVVSKHSIIGKGSIILPGAIIGPNVTIGDNCIINCNAIVSHGSVVGNHVHLAPGSVLAGNCQVGELTTIGMNSTVYESLKIGRNCLTYNNSSVLTNLDDNQQLDQNREIKKRK
tara:strand:+ start:100 stop:1188 length:1089 start_codon:yes stop_codon:yes gene_type:complete